MTREKSQTQEGVGITSKACSFKYKTWVQNPSGLSHSPLIRYTLVHGGRYSLFYLADLGIGSGSGVHDALASGSDQHQDGVKKHV